MFDIETNCQSASIYCHNKTLQKILNVKCVKWHAGILFDNNEMIIMLHILNVETWNLTNWIKLDSGNWFVKQLM